MNPDTEYPIIEFQISVKDESTMNPTQRWEEIKSIAEEKLKRELMRREQEQG